MRKCHLRRREEGDLGVRKHRLLVVDGHAYAYRAFYAIRNLRAPSGKAVNGIYGFVKMLAKLRAGLQPTHVVVVWDGGMDCERLAALPEYKAHRPEMPADLAEQIDGMMEFLNASGVPSVCVEGVEADDWIGCVAREAERAGWEVIIASADKDFLQLVTLESGGADMDGRDAAPGAGSGTGWVGLLNPNDKSERIWGVAEVRNKTGVAPTQVLDWLSLLGDAVDGIPGVPGVGAKTAAGLLSLFGSVEGLYARLSEVKSERVREGLRAAEKDVRRNQGLVALKRVNGFEFVPENLVVKPMSVERLKALYSDWGFRGMLAELKPPQEQQQSLI
jgi:DNA polymerase-1